MALRDSIKNLKISPQAQAALDDPETRWVLLFVLIVVIGAILYGVSDQVRRPKLKVIPGGAANAAA